eukprot:6504722-Pyramimonas_sp.AAC.1
MGADPNCPPAAKKILEDYWTTVVMKKPVQDLASEVRACRIRPTKKVEGKPELFRITLAVDVKYRPLEEAI